MQKFNLNKLIKPIGLHRRVPKMDGRPSQCLDAPVAFVRGRRCFWAPRSAPSASRRLETHDMSTAQVAFFDVGAVETSAVNPRGDKKQVWGSL